MTRFTSYWLRPWRSAIEQHLVVCVGTALWLWIEKRLMEVICTVYKNHKLSLTETFAFTKDEWVKFTNHFKLTELSFETETESDRRVKQMIVIINVFKTLTTISCCRLRKKLWLITKLNQSYVKALHVSSYTTILYATENSAWWIL